MKRRTALKRRTPLRSAPKPIDLALRRAVFERDGFRCQFPAAHEQSCRGPLDPHHVHPRGRGGRDTLANLITLCRFHHRWVHEHPEVARTMGLLR